MAAAERDSNKTNKGKKHVKVTSELWHKYFSFAPAFTLIVNKITRNMNARELTDVVEVRRLLWEELRNRMGDSDILAKQWSTLQEFLRDMIARPLPSHDFGGPQIAPGITRIYRPVIEPHRASR